MGLAKWIKMHSYNGIYTAIKTKEALDVFIYYYFIF